MYAFKTAELTVGAWDILACSCSNSLILPFPPPLLCDLCSHRGSARVGDICEDGLLQDTHTQWFVCGGSDLGDEWNREGQEIYKLKVKVMTGARLLIPGSSLHRSEGESSEKMQ